MRPSRRRRMHLRQGRKQKLITATSHPHICYVTSDTAPGIWESPISILVLLAHPDDPEFFCGATLAGWARAGHKITYQLLTCGDKGFNDATHADMSGVVETFV